MGASDQMAQAITEAQPTDAALQEGAAYSTATPENPLQRNIVVSVRASLNELCLQKQKGTWAPSTEALRSMFQQKVRYTHTRTTRRPPPTSPQPLTRLAPVRPVRRSTRASTAPPMPRVTSRASCSTRWTCSTSSRPSRAVRATPYTAGAGERPIFLRASADLVSPLSCSQRSAPASPASTTRPTRPRERPSRPWSSRTRTTTAPRSCRPTTSASPTNCACTTLRQSLRQVPCLSSCF